MGLDDFTKSTSKKARSPHSDFEDRPARHIVNFMLSVEVDPESTDDTLATARQAVMELEESARNAACEMEVLGPAEIVDENLDTIETVSENDIGIIWRTKARAKV